MNAHKFLIFSVISVILTISTAAVLDAREFVEGKAKPNSFWWPEQLNLHKLRAQSEKSNPYGADFNYAEEFKKLDIEAVKADIDKLLTESQDWWPADYGNYGPLFIRMAWHSAGTYRIHDGRGGGEGGQQRFDPLNSWPDNGNLDKARRLLWPVKKKYGRGLSWGDLMVLAGNVAMDNMGFKTYGFAGGRPDDWEPDIVYWGPETEFLAHSKNRRDKDGKIKRPLGAIHMGLIYVNPAGPDGKPDPLASAKDIRDSFGRMAMNDEETVALIAGGHTFGKMHGARKESCVGAEPGGAAIEEQGFGWKSKCGKGHSEDTITSGFEGAWTAEPVMWTSMYLDNLLNFEWKLVKSPAGNVQWIPTDEDAATMVRDAHVEGKFHAPVMTTADLALKADPEYRKIAERFHDDHEEFEKAYGKAWFKLTHRDMGPKARYIVTGGLPEEDLIWQDPVPSGEKLSKSEVRKLKKQILDSGLSTQELIRTAWAAASSYRDTDRRGGANGARIALEPQINWQVNSPDELKKVLDKLKEIKEDFDASLADVIVLAGAAAIEKAAKDAGVDIEVPFASGRGDTSQEQTDVVSFAVLEPKADGFRNYYSEDSYLSPTNALIEKASFLNLTVPEMTVLLGGMRSLGANYMDSNVGVLTINRSVNK